MSEFVNPFQVVQDDMIFFFVLTALMIIGLFVFTFLMQRKNGKMLEAIERESVARFEAIREDIKKGKE